MSICRTTALGRGCDCVLSAAQTALPVGRGRWVYGVGRLGLRLVAPLLFVLLPVLSCSGFKPSMIPDMGERRVRVGIYDNKPLVFLDGEGNPSGLFVEILNHITSKYNWKVEYVYGSWSEVFAQLREGEIDLLAAIARDEQRAEYLDFNSEPVIAAWGQVYVRTADKRDFDELHDFNTMEVGVIRHDAHAEAFRDMVSFFKMKTVITEFERFEQLFRALVDGSIDAAVAGRFTGEEMVGAAVRKTDIRFNIVNVHFAAVAGEHTRLLELIDQELYFQKRFPGSAYHAAYARWIPSEVTSAGQPVDGEQAVCVYRWIFVLALGTIIYVFSTIVLLAKNSDLGKRNHRLRMLLEKAEDNESRLEREIYRLRKDVEKQEY